MNFVFPSREFDEVVAAVCRGQASEEESRALNELLRTSPAARDEYILRVEVHSRLASEPEMFVSVANEEAKTFLSGTCAIEPAVIPFPTAHRLKNRKLVWATALAACLTALATGILVWQNRHPAVSEIVGGKAVAILNRTVDAQWSQSGKIPQVGTQLQPGRLELRAGLAQFVFYSGARVMIEGPAQIDLTSPNEISCRSGRLMAEVPSPARAFSIRTPHAEATSVTASVGLNVRGSSTEVQVFKGSAEVSANGRVTKQNFTEGTAALVEKSHPLKSIPADGAAFTSLIDLQSKSLEAEAQRYTQWHAASGRLNHDPSLIAHIDFAGIADSPQSPLLKATDRGAVSQSIVGCQMVSGRWADKEGLEFQNVNDCIRLTVPGEYNSLTLTAWVRVEALDRQFNSLFMCDGFEPGEIHWMIVNDGALALTVKGANRGYFQAVQSQPVLSPDMFGTWVQVAAVLNGRTKRATLYLNGRMVHEQQLTTTPPFHIGDAELGNWNPDAFPVDNQEMWIRNFNGAMDEFCLFSRALSDREIQELYLEGKPEGGN